MSNSIEEHIIFDSKKTDLSSEAEASSDTKFNRLNLNLGGLKVNVIYQVQITTDINTYSRVIKIADTAVGRFVIYYELMHILNVHQLIK